MSGGKEGAKVPGAKVGGIEGAPIGMFDRW